MAKLNRSDLKRLKKRLSLAIEKSKQQDFDVPYRMLSSFSKCGFVFIPLEFKNKDSADIALKYYIDIHMYDQKLDKAIGILAYYNPITNH